MSAAASRAAMTASGARVGRDGPGGNDISDPIPRSTPAPGRSATQDSADVARIFMNAVLSQPLTPEDQRRVAKIVAQRTGMTRQEAEQRMSQNHAQMQARLQQAVRFARLT